MTEFIFMITLRFQLYSSLIVEGFLDLAVLLLCVSAGILIAKGDLAVLSPLLHSIIASGDSTPFFVSNTCNTPWNCCSVMMWLSLIHVPSDAALNDCPDSWFLSFSGYHLHCTGADHLYHLWISLCLPHCSFTCQALPYSWLVKNSFKAAGPIFPVSWPSYFGVGHNLTCSVAVGSCLWSTLETLQACKCCIVQLAWLLLDRSRSWVFYNHLTPRWPELN